MFSTDTCCVNKHQCVLSQSRFPPSPLISVHAAVCEPWAVCQSSKQWVIFLLLNTKGNLTWKHSTGRTQDLQFQDAWNKESRHPCTLCTKMGFCSTHPLITVPCRCNYLLLSESCSSESPFFLPCRLTTSPYKPSTTQTGSPLRQ